MKKKLTYNWFLKLLSILFAFILWLVVVNINDPDRTVRITGIPIEILNEEEITKQGIGQVYQIESPANGYGSITVRGPRSLVDNLERTKNGISAAVNFSEVSSVGAVPITYTIPDGVTLVSRNVTTMRIKVEAMEQQMFDVSMELIGTPADGYTTGTFGVSPNRLKIIAPMSLLEKIQKVVLEVNVEGVSTDIQAQEAVSNLKLMDANGKVIEYQADKDHVTFSISNVNINLTMLQIKSVPIQVSVSGNVPDGYRYIGAEVGDNMRKVQGLPNKIADFSQITIPESERILDLANVTSDDEIKIDIREYLPYGIELANGEDPYLTVKLKVQQLHQQTFPLNPSDLDVRNQSPGLNLTYNITGEVRIVVGGLSQDLEGLSLEHMEPYIDLAGMAAGTHNVPIHLTLPDGVTLEQMPTLSVTLSVPETETTSPETVESTSPIEEETTANTSSTSSAESEENETTPAVSFSETDIPPEVVESL